LYTIPGAAFLGLYGWGAANGYDEIHQMAYLVSSLCCIGALAGLSTQTTSRLGNNLGMVRRGGGCFRKPEEKELLEDLGARRTIILKLNLTLHLSRTFKFLLTPWAIGYLNI
jgi:hypothetical protein